MKISVVIPSYNEEERIDATLTKIESYLKEKNIAHEIIVVDDGSTDMTRNVVKGHKGVILTEKRKNKGKGYSVKEGMLRAHGEYALLTDADLSTPIEELDSFLEEIKKYDIVIGSRALPQSHVKTIFYKKILGRIGNIFISWLAVKNIKDTQCGFKLFRTGIAKKIFRKQTIDRFGFDFEILHIAQRQGISIKEQPVKWIRNEKSKVSLLDYPMTFIELIKIKMNDMKGVYG